MTAIRNTAARSFDDRTVFQSVSEAGSCIGNLCEQAYSKGMEKLPLVKTVMDYFSKKSVEEQKKAPQKKEYSHILGSRSGGNSTYFETAAEILERCECPTYAREFAYVSDGVKAGLGVITIVNAIDKLPNRIVRTMEVLKQEDTARKVNMVSDVVCSSASALSAISKIARAVLKTVSRTMEAGVSASYKLTMTRVVKGLSITSRMISGAYFVFLAMPRLYALKEIYDVKKSFKKILNDKTIAGVEKKVKVREFLNERLQLKDAEKVKIYENAEKELKAEFLKNKPNARSWTVKLYVESKIKDKLSHAVHEGLNAKKEAFNRTFGKKTFDLLAKLNKKRKISNEESDEIIGCIHRSINRQTFINVLALIGATLALAATVITQILSGGSIYLVPFVLSVISTSIWLGFDLYQLIKDLKMKNLTSEQIFYKFMNFIFFATSLLIAEIVSTNMYTSGALVAGSIVWLLAGMYLKYRSNKKAQNLTKIKSIDSKVFDSFKKLRV